MINAVGSRMMIEINRQKSLARTISDTQVTISTGKKIQRASDNPVAAARVEVIGRAQANSNAWAINLDTGLSLNSQADTAVTGMADRIALARELVLGGANGTLAQTDRNMIAAQLDGIADELDGLVNRKSANGQPLFATGTALSVRYDENTVFAPVPSQAQVFDAGGISLSQMVRDAATALRSGSAPAIGASITTLGHRRDQDSGRFGRYRSAGKALAVTAGSRTCTRHRSRGRKNQSRSDRHIGSCRPVDRSDIDAGSRAGGFCKDQPTHAARSTFLTQVFRATAVLQPVAHSAKRVAKSGMKQAHSCSQLSV
jgi:flagellar hook-associated protein 3 FlgL